MTLGETFVGTNVHEANAAFAAAGRLAHAAGAGALSPGVVYEAAMAQLVARRRREAEQQCRDALQEMGGIGAPNSQQGGRPIEVDGGRPADMQRQHHRLAGCRRMRAH